MKRVVAAAVVAGALMALSTRVRNMRRCHDWKGEAGGDERSLDKAIEETFPASDPPTITVEAGIRLRPDRFARRPALLHITPALVQPGTPASEARVPRSAVTREIKLGYTQSRRSHSSEEPSRSTAVLDTFVSKRN